MKKIVYVVYHNLNVEERSYELLKCCSLIGNVELVTIAIPNGFPSVKVHLIDKKSKVALLKLLHTAKKVIKCTNPDIVVLHDNDCSALIPFIKRKFKNAKIVYDSSELYINKELPEQYKNDVKINKNSDGIMIRIKQVLTSFRSRCEKKYLKYCDCVIAANIERAKIMYDYFSLCKLPLIFDNVHRINEYSDEEKCSEKFDKYFNNNAFNILFAGGISEERNTFDFIKDFMNVKQECNLIIVGNASKCALNNYNELLNNYNDEMRKKVSYIGFISRPELKYLMGKCCASVVIFDKNYYNTIYCESGKFYESLFEGTPIICSENPPLKRMCEKYKIGVSNDNYTVAINEMINNYELYKNNVQNFIEIINYDNRVIKLRDQIIDEIK